MAVGCVHLHSVTATLQRPVELLKGSRRLLQPGLVSFERGQQALAANVVVVELTGQGCDLRLGTALLAGQVAVPVDQEPERSGLQRPRHPIGVGRLACRVLQLGPPGDRRLIDPVTRQLPQQRLSRGIQ
jgi:hypothetical protein